MDETPLSPTTDLRRLPPRPVGMARHHRPPTMGLQGGARLVVVPRPRLCLRSLPRDLQPDRRRARMLPTTKHLRVLRSGSTVGGRRRQGLVGVQHPGGEVVRARTSIRASRDESPVGWHGDSLDPERDEQHRRPEGYGGGCKSRRIRPGASQSGGSTGTPSASRRSGARTHFPPKLSAALCRFGRSNTQSADGRQSLASTTRESRTSLVRRETVTTRRRQLQGEVQHIDDELEIIDRELRHRSYAA
jgi:hypothetical protein